MMKQFDKYVKAGKKEYLLTFTYYPEGGPVGCCLSVKRFDGWHYEALIMYNDGKLNWSKSWVEKETPKRVKRVIEKNIEQLKKYHFDPLQAVSL